jgi:hypothetical protein
MGGRETVNEGQDAYCQAGIGNLRSQTSTLFTSTLDSAYGSELMFTAYRAVHTIEDIMHAESAKEALERSTPCPRGPTLLPGSYIPNKAQEPPIDSTSRQKCRNLSLY